MHDASQHASPSSENLGLYVSVPFCRAKCSFCNFASGVFAAERLEGYLARVIEEMCGTQAWVRRMGMPLPGRVDTVYFGGGTPSLLEPAQVRTVFAAMRSVFDLTRVEEITVEAAPGQLGAATLEAMLTCGVDRLSFGVQSFVDAECARIGRSHTGAECLAEFARLRAAGVARLGLDLIAGLPGQTRASWLYSVETAIASGVEHVSLYMLEVDEGSRLGREAQAGGTRYGAGELPDADRVAAWYEEACAWLEAAGLAQYEISNFARAGGQSRHNRRYWERRPYLGFGLDAHSMLRDERNGSRGVRWANERGMEGYIGLPGESAWSRAVDRIGVREAFEETVFLGLRLVEGVRVSSLREQFGALVDAVAAAIEDCREAGLLTLADGCWRLTGAGRMASNEVFERLLLPVQTCPTISIEPAAGRRMAFTLA